MKKTSFWQIWLITSLLTVMTVTIKAQENYLALDDIFASPKLTGTTPSRPVWAPNSKHFAFSWNKPGNPGRLLWVSTNDGNDVRLISKTKTPSVRILGTLLDELERRVKETALATLCIGSGLGSATIIERV